MPAPHPSDRDALPGSPAATLALVGGALALLLSLNPSAVALTLFAASVTLCVVPLALSDRAGTRLTRRALIGGACAAVALGVVVIPLLGQS